MSSADSSSSTSTSSAPLPISPPSGPPSGPQTREEKTREQLQVCWHLFGFGDDPFQIERGRDGQAPWLGPRMEHSPFRDVLFVSIHVTGSFVSGKDPALVGVSILDTRHLQSYMDSGDTASPNIITSHLLQTEHMDGIPFGTVELVEEKFIGEYLQKLVGTRHWILVSYMGGLKDLACAEQIDIPPAYHLELASIIRFALPPHRYSLLKYFDVLKLHPAQWAQPQSEHPGPRPDILFCLEAVANAWGPPEMVQPCLKFVPEPEDAPEPEDDPNPNPNPNPRLRPKPKRRSQRRISKMRREKEWRKANTAKAKAEALADAEADDEAEADGSTIVETDEEAEGSTLAKAIPKVPKPLYSSSSGEARSSSADWPGPFFRAPPRSPKGE
ncbi:hypothetical protein F5Y01DRAFT_315153 [Xylaria sp. FL0043]|nr:hypothetical protein F5Y01DRAFT_315153 [Xylaria sp. FL0043]